MSLATHLDCALRRLPCSAFGQRYRDPPSAPSILAIVLHDCDNALPSGKPFFIGTSAWFKPVFDAARVGEALQRNCLVHILDLFTDSLERIVAQAWLPVLRAVGIA